MTVEDIVRAYLEEHGYDGLYNEDAECACLASDLFPCCGEPDHCEAGYRCDCDGTREGCEIPERLDGIGAEPSRRGKEAGAGAAREGCDSRLRKIALRCVISNDAATPFPATSPRAKKRDTPSLASLI